jgi:hypothetical protein
MAGALSGNRSGWAPLRREQQEQLESNHHENQATGKEGEANHRHHKHRPRKRRNGCVPMGFLGRTALRRSNVASRPVVRHDREISNYTTAVAKWWLYKQRPLLGNGWRAITLEPQQIWTQQWHSNRWMMFFVWSIPRCYEHDKLGAGES